MPLSTRAAVLPLSAIRAALGFRRRGLNEKTGGNGMKHGVIAAALTGAALSGLVASGLAAQSAPAPAPAVAAGSLAAKFGARDDVLGVSISPDGQSIAILQTTGARGTVLRVAPVDGSAEPKAIVSADGDPKRLVDCRWATSDRLVCTLFMVEMLVNAPRAGTRLISISADGRQMRELSARANYNSLGVALGGGQVIDWLDDERDGSVLMTRLFIPEQQTGSFTASRREGVGVERVNLRTGSRTVVEHPNGSASTYVSDGHGVVRLMAIERTNNQGAARGQIDYRYRKKGSREWLPLTTGTYANYQYEGFQPVAIDSELDVVYGLESSEGRPAVFSVALDGSMKKTLVFSGPAHAFGIDQLVRIGRSRRVVGASWIAERRETAMFDPALKRLTASLARALPGQPGLSVVDASADEQRLVLYAGTDRDPGRFYLFDKATKRLSEILPVRAGLAGVALAEMRPISYPAADGTRIPAYITLPPGGATKGLPAIVLPHGGPSYRDEWSFDWLPQFFAARGYAVIQPQYRGSVGYGSTFFGENAIRGWRQAITDVNDAGRWLVREGIADPAKLAVVGWSYGGYAALQSQVVDPDLFKAVVAIAPVTDWAQLRADYLRGGMDPGQLAAMFGDAAVLEAGSPARHAARFRAPVLMFMGDYDQNVPVEQPRRMRDRLRDAGKSVQYFEYDRLDHQLEDSAVRTTMLDESDRFLRRALGM